VSCHENIGDLYHQHPKSQTKTKTVALQPDQHRQLLKELGNYQLVLDYALNKLRYVLGVNDKKALGS
jgi:hypothetical protein